MNSATITRVGQAICRYLLKQAATASAGSGSSTTKKPHVVICFDHRYDSRYFAHISAALMLTNGISVTMCDELSSTPLVPFLVAHLKADMGIQVTASHNPKNDNGYKVYGANAAQIVGDIVDEIQALMVKEEEPMDTSKYLRHHPFNCLTEQGIQECCVTPEQMTKYWHEYQRIIFHINKLMLPIGQKIDDGSIQATNLWNHGGAIVKPSTANPVAWADSSFKVVYTAMHGVGYKFIQDLILNTMKFPADRFVVVKEQIHPDPEFPTVVFPNPEEKKALDLGYEIGSATNANILIANDPDADRFAAAELINGKWRLFTGDEIGYMFAAKQLEWMNSDLPRDTVGMICSAVSSQFVGCLCAEEKLNFTETLTGFKWMMNTALDQKDRKILLCYEEALGYGLTTDIPDKDGMSAAAFWLLIAHETYKAGETMTGVLEKLYKKYGYFASQNSYWKCGDLGRVPSLFEKFRIKYPTEIGGYKVARIRDLAVNHDSGTSDGKCELPLTGENVLTIWFENSTRITFRASGTEPKLKYYAEMRHPSSKEEAAQALRGVLAATKAFFVEDAAALLLTDAAA
jgi:phosphoglucomutase